MRNVDDDVKLRYFNNAGKNPEESDLSFLKRLRQIAKQGEYEQVVEDTLVVDISIFGIYLKSALKSLIKEAWRPKHQIVKSVLLGAT